MLKTIESTKVEPQKKPAGNYLRAVPSLFERLRLELGGEIEFLHDVHSRLTPIEAARLAKSTCPEFAIRISETGSDD